MRTTTQVTLVNGRRLRITRLDNCGRIVYGDDNVAISDAFVSVSAKTNTTSTSAVEVKNANGDVIVKVPEKTSFANYGLEIAFAKVDPELFALVTGQRVLTDANGNPVGFSVDSAVDLEGQGIALEIWAGSPAGDACTDPNAQGSYGYVLFPFLQGGVLGDHSIQEGAISFTITGVTSNDGNGWGVGPYNVMLNGSGQPAKLAEPLTSTEHEAFLIVGVTPPDATAGTRPQLDPAATPVTALAFSATTGHAGTFTVTGGGAGVGVWYDFGDGTWDYVTGTTTTHTYAAAGTYVAKASSNGTWVTHSSTVS